MLRYCIFFLLLTFSSAGLFAQRLLQEGGLPAMEDSGRDSTMDADSVNYTAKYIRYTNLKMFKEGTQTRMIDTTVYNVHNYSPLYQFDRPTIGLGGNGLAYREMLFNPSKTIGFDAGFHTLDFYKLGQDSMRFYRARSPFTELYYVNGRREEQTFKATHSQNVKPNLNVGANYNRISAEGFYKNQTAEHLNGAFFAWYESKNSRYNILGDALFNTLKAAENGGPTIFNLFELEGDDQVDNVAVPVHLTGIESSLPRQTWRQTQLFLHQSYYIGRMDSLLSADSTLRILPTQRLSHTMTLSWDQYRFYKNEEGVRGAFPLLPSQSFILTADSTKVRNFRNEFNYSFYLRGKSVSFLKNELKLNLGLQNDIYKYQQMGYEQNFTNTMLKAAAGYQFSDKVGLEVDLNQIAQGRNFGDFLYDAKANFLLSKSVGRIQLGAYLQNKSPEQMFERVNYQYHTWNFNAEKSKISNLSFAYENPALRLGVKAEYFLVNNHLYYRETAVAGQIEPVQSGTNINLLKVTLAKNFVTGKFHLDNYIVYQKTDFQDILRTPELYSYNSFYFNNRFFQVLQAHIGFDVRFNTPFKAPAYAINVSQFYNDNNALEYSTYPVVDVWIRATLKRTNLFLKYDYLNQGVFSEGYYTVRNYPMPDKLLKFGVIWKFYN